MISELCCSPSHNLIIFNAKIKFGNKSRARQPSKFEPMHTQSHAHNAFSFHKSHARQYLLACEHCPANKQYEKRNTVSRMQSKYSTKKKENKKYPPKFETKRHFN